MRDPVLLAVLALAAVLRIYGLDHGLPYVYNPDEANIMARALSIAQGLDPGYYLYPSFFFYFLFGVMGALYVVGRAAGRYESLDAFQERFFTDPTDFYLAGRLVGVVAALGTIWLTYHLASKHFGRTAGRASALFMAVAYFNVRDAHYLKHDVPAGLLLILALWAIDRAIETKSVKAHVLAGIALGVAFATHYYMIFLAPTFIACHWANRRLKGFSSVLIAGAASAVTFFVLSPFVILKLPTALEHMRANRQVVVDRSLEAGSTLFPSLGLYFDFLLTQGLGYLLVGLTVIGMWLVARRGLGELTLWGVFPVMFFAFISYTFFAGRYLNPILPCLAVFAGVVVARVESRFGFKAAAMLAMLASLQPIYQSIQIDRLFASEDTRSVARRWVIDNIPSGDTLALQSYSVPLPQSAASFRESLEANDGLGELERHGKYSSLLDVAASESVAYPLYFFGRGDELNRIYVGYDELLDGLGSLEALGVSFVVLRRPPTSPPPEVSALFERVAREATLRHSVSPFEGANGPPYLDNEDWPPRSSLSMRGPKIEIWTLDGEPAGDTPNERTNRE